MQPCCSVLSVRLAYMLSKPLMQEITSSLATYILSSFSLEDIETAFLCLYTLLPVATWMLSRGECQDTSQVFLFLSCKSFFCLAVREQWIIKFFLLVLCLSSLLWLKNHGWFYESKGTWRRGEREGERATLLYALDVDIKYSTGITNMQRWSELHKIWATNGVSRWNGEDNEYMYESFGMDVTAKHINSSLVEQVKSGSLTLIGHLIENLKGLVC